MSPNLRLDVPRIKSEFVTGIHTSVRAAARHHGVAQATLARYAQEKDEQGLTWYDHRDSYMAQRTNKAYELLADKDAVQFAARIENVLGISDDLLGLVREQIPLWREQIKDGKTPIGIKETLAILDQMVTLAGGRPKDKEETSKPNVLFANIVNDPNALASLESAIRSGDTNGRAAPRVVGADSQGEGAD